MLTQLDTICGRDINIYFTCLNKKLHCKGSMKNREYTRGITNILSLLLMFFMLKEYYVLFEWKNITLFLNLFYIKNPINVCILLFIIIGRTFLLFFRPKLLILIICEIIIYHMIYTRIHGIIAFNVTLIAMISSLKIYSFITELATIRNSKTSCEKPATKTKMETLHVACNEIPFCSRNIIKNRCAGKNDADMFWKDAKTCVVEDPRILDYFRFMFMPTLIFSDFTDHRRRSFKNLLYCIIMTAFFFFAANFMISFYLLPLMIKYTMVDFFTSIIAFVQISVTTFIIWILLFLFFFKFYLSFMSECTNYHVKSYGHWWNATSFREFWQLWNTTTHNWLRKYVYQEAIVVIRSKWLCSLLVFFISGALHELIYFLTFKKLGFVVFSSIFLQFFFILFENTCFASGNLLFWLIFCLIGQPVFLLSIRKSTISLLVS